MWKGDQAFVLSLEMFNDREHEVRALHAGQHRVAYRPPRFLVHCACGLIYRKIKNRFLTSRCCAGDANALDRRSGEAISKSCTGSDGMD